MFKNSQSGTKTKGSDACTAVGQASVTTVESARECLRLLPFNEQIRQSTMDTVLNAMQLYAFRDIKPGFQFPNGQFQTDIDIISELQKLKTRAYSVAMDFHGILII